MTENIFAFLLIAALLCGFFVLAGLAVEWWLRRRARVKP